MIVCDICKKPAINIERVFVEYMEGELTTVKNGQSFGGFVRYCARRELCNECRKLLAKHLMSWSR